MTRRQLCELIQRRLAGGDVPIGFSPKIEEISLWLEPAVAAAAFKNYTDGAQVDIENVGDAFYMRFTNLTLALDSDTGEYYVDVPASPYGIPFGYDVSGAYLISGDGRKADMYRAHQRQVGVFDKLQKPAGAGIFWFEGAQMRVVSDAVLTGMKAMVVMASLGTATNMDEIVHCPSDQLPFVIDYVERKFLQAVPEDLSNDGNNKR